MALDNLNKFDNLVKAIPYEKYFGEMDLDDEQKEKRIDTASKFEDVVLYVLLLILATEITSKVHDREYYSEVLSRRLKDVLSVTDSHVEEYIDKVSMEIVDATLDHIEDNYYLSLDRAMYIAENESNSVWNYLEWAEAVKAGYKKKMWQTMRDKTVRHTHVIADNQTVGINDFFTVGNSKMLYPKDENAEAKEIINCRCSLKFI